MIVDQYRPQTPDTANELHSLTLMRMQARNDADAAYNRLNRRVQGFFKPDTNKSGPLGMLLHNIPTIITGITFGKKIVASLRKK